MLNFGFNQIQAAAKYRKPSIWSCIYSGYTIILTVKACPDEDPISLKYVLRLSPLPRTASSNPHRRGALRVPAPGRVASQARPRPAQVRRGTRRHGRDGRSHRGRAGRLGRQRRPLAAPGRSRGARGGVGVPSQGAAVQPLGRRGRSAAPAVGPVHAAGRPGAWDIAVIHRCARRTS